MNTAYLQIINKGNPEEDFKRIASYLINDCVLIVGEAEYSFTTLEFYYKNESQHKDIYTHGRDQQKEFAKWYVHESGLDMTFGDNENHGGILIRGLKRGDTYFNGPLICLWEIFAQFGDINSSKDLKFYIKEVRAERLSSVNQNEILYQSRRFGLVEKPQLDVDNRFLNAQYRFFIDPKETQKDKGNIANDLLLQMKGENENDNMKMVNDILFGYDHFKVNSLT